MIVKICRKVIKNNSDNQIFVFMIIGLFIYLFSLKKKKKKILKKKIDDSNKLYISNIVNNEDNYAQIEEDPKMNVKFNYDKTKKVKFFDSNKEKNKIYAKINEKLSEKFNYDNIYDNKYDIDYENSFNPINIDNDYRERDNKIDNKYSSNKKDNIDENKKFIENPNIYDVNNKKIVKNDLKLRNENVDMNRTIKFKDFQAHNKNINIISNDSLNQKYKEQLNLETFSGVNFMERDKDFGLKDFDESKNINLEELYKRRTLLLEEERLEIDSFNKFNTRGLAKPKSSLKPNKNITQKDLDKYKGLKIKDIYHKFIHNYKNVDVQKILKDSNIQGSFISENAYKNLDIKN